MRLIDADAFIAKLDNIPMVQEAIKKAVDHMPTIEPKKGKWLTNEEIVRPTRFIKWFCSRCGYVFESVDSPGYKFCPNCGSYNGGDEE